MQKAFRERVTSENARITLATDSEFWCAACFFTREEKEAFLDLIGWDRGCDGDKYLDGRKLAQLAGIDPAALEARRKEIAAEHEQQNTNQKKACGLPRAAN
ncbi:hypothetical protein Srot_2111 [Segniliparus rotundus DSM 44985]|uniref:Uncharacterized protein n=1 Tax=Segniliparus rotundus (strain ATCC BAA-972 / CDC 1076 / CIP 108378 / DSM 44985 / JCM 13578) TaxID=640132 RepID=D6Z9D5_SEGRD|nr:hypothetical protein Srot_2111 [Segniliparus rotundus DSM 44985]